MTERIIDALDLPFPVAGTDVIVGCSVGISVARGGTSSPTSCSATPTWRCTAPRPTASAASSLRPDDARARSSSVTSSRRTWGGASPAATSRSSTSRSSTLATASIVGVEALVRWRHPTRGLDRPGGVHPPRRGERHDRRARPVGPRTATRQVVDVASPSPASSDLALSVNLSPLQLQHPGFIDEVARRYRRIGIDPRDLTFEMTETAMFRDTAATIATLEPLRELGVRIAMDDFGTGYSSLATCAASRWTSSRSPGSSSARPTPMSRRPGHSPGPSWRSAARSACRSSPRASRPTSSSAMLRRLGCELGQGYLFGRPASAEAIEGILFDGVSGPLNEQARPERPAAERARTNASGTLLPPRTRSHASHAA